MISISFSDKCTWIYLSDCDWRFQTTDVRDCPLLTCFPATQCLQFLTVLIMSLDTSGNVFREMFTFLSRDDCFIFRTIACTLLYLIFNLLKLPPYFISSAAEAFLCGTVTSRLGNSSRFMAGRPPFPIPIYFEVVQRSFA